MTTQAKVKIAITVPATVVQRLQNPHALRQWLVACGVWPVNVYDMRVHIDPLSRATVIEGEVFLPLGEKE